jgi:hypothetical protein
MKQKTINVVIAPDGTVEVSPEGFGKKCKDATKFLEDALGLDVSKRTHTAEFFATETVKQNQNA